MKKWKYIGADKETDQRFLNFYTAHYELDIDGEKKPYDYFLASRNEVDTLKPKTHDFTKADAVYVPLYYIDPKTKEVSLLITRQFRPAIGSYIHSCVAGLIDPEDSSYEEAVRREAREEAGVEVNDIEVLGGASPTSSGLSDESNALVVARIVSFGEQKLEECEDISTMLVPLKEARAMLDDPQYTFAMMARLAVLYLYERFK